MSFVLYASQEIGGKDLVGHCLLMMERITEDRLRNLPQLFDLNLESAVLPPVKGLTPTSRAAGGAEEHACSFFATSRYMLSWGMKCILVTKNLSQEGRLVRPAAKEKDKSKPLKRKNSNKMVQSSQLLLSNSSVFFPAFEVHLALWLFDFLVRFFYLEHGVGDIKPELSPDLSLFHPSRKPTENAFPKRVFEFPVIEWETFLSTPLSNVFTLNAGTAPLPVDDGYKVIASERFVSCSRLLFSYRLVHPIVDTNKLAAPISADERASPNYIGLVDAIHNGEGKCWTAKVFYEEELIEAIETATGPKKDCLCVHKDDTSEDRLTRISNGNVLYRGYAFDSNNNEFTYLGIPYSVYHYKKRLISEIWITVSNGQMAVASFGTTGRSYVWEAVCVGYSSLIELRSRNDLPSWNSPPLTPEARMAYYRSVRSCLLSTLIPNLEDTEPIWFSQTRIESFIFFIRLPSRSRSSSGTRTSSLFDMVSFHQSPNIDSTGSKGFTSEPFLAFLPWA
ncbi:hypothetical protein RJT34_17618 [Clitoria ternatea]|uniref:Uncharacterized protein n=1 Tax=Clitoria ternatea TaxID=43366 RepID=A0AAN9PDG0_CLITE